jgi:tetratricopeptide (TPR) repeat protein
VSEHLPVRGPIAVELLLAKSFSLRYQDPDRMIELAELARIAAERLDPKIYGEATVADLQMRAWAELGNAYRVGDDLFAADEALERAVVCAQDGTGDLRRLARVGDLAASLRADQRRFADACEVLQLLQIIYQALGEEHLVGRALISEGTFAGHDGRPKEGLLLVCEGLLRVDPNRDPKLKALGLHALVFNLIEAKRYRKARTLLWHIRPFFEQDGEHLNILRLRWLEGKICSGLEDFELGEEHFQYVRREFEKCRQHYDCALVSLDLAMLWLRQGRREETRQLALELINYFRALGIAREAAASLIVYRQWAESDYVSNDILHDKLKLTAALLEELERQKPRKP